MEALTSPANEARDALNRAVKKLSESQSPDQVTAAMVTLFLTMEWALKHAPDTLHRVAYGEVVDLARSVLRQDP